MKEDFAISFKNLGDLAEKAAPDVLAQYDQIKQEGGEIHNSDLMKLQHLPNLTKLSRVICDGKSPQDIPPSVKLLGLVDTSLQKPLPINIRHVSLESVAIETWDILPPKLTSLILHNLWSAFLIDNLPITLRRLTVNNWENSLEVDVDLTYLTNLLGFKLDVTRGCFALPKSIRYIEIENGTVEHLTRSMMYPAVRSMKFTNCNVRNKEQLDCKLPDSLISLYIDTLDLEPGYQYFPMNFNLPNQLQLFHVSSQLILSSDVILPDQLKQLHLKVGGFYHERDESFNSIQRIELPLNLKKLTLEVEKLQLPQNYFSGLSSLHTVNLRGSLSSLDIQSTRIYQLDISDNAFTSTSQLRLPETLANLNLSYNPLKDLKQLPKSLQILHLSGIKHNLDRTFFERFRYLKELRVSGYSGRKLEKLQMIAGECYIDTLLVKKPWFKL